MCIYVLMYIVLWYNKENNKIEQSENMATKKSWKKCIDKKEFIMELLNTDRDRD